MFLLPKILGSNDKIIVQGTTFYQRRQLTVGLVTGFNSPDHLNVACQLNIFFNNPDKIAVQVIENGNIETINESNAATDYFPDPQFFEVHFRVRSEEILDVIVGDSLLDSIRLKHDVNNIRFLSVHGDVEKVSRLDFNFG